MSGPAAAWLAAAGDPGIAGALERIYEEMSDAIARREPVCRASGRCCNFEKTGHRLYVTGLEAAYTVSRLEQPPTRPAGLALFPGRGTLLTHESLAAARARGDCPFLANRLCSVHAIRPLGCRAYFCDPTAQEWQQDLSERMLARVRAIHDLHEIEYRYGEWRAMLGLFLPT